MIIKCQECDHEITGTDCPECGESTPQESIHCINCGEKLQKDAEDSIEEDDEFGLEDRVLCPDGTCTGIIIDDKCSECGKGSKPEA